MLGGYFSTWYKLVSTRYMDRIEYLGVNVRGNLNYISHLGKIGAKLLNVVGQVRIVHKNGT